MKKVSVLHTLRLYDPILIEKVGGLMESEESKFKNKNEFLTEIMRLGLERYAVHGKNTGSASAASQDNAQENAWATYSDCIKESYSLLSEIAKYLTAQFKRLNIEHRVSQAMLSATYNIVCGLNNDMPLMPQKIDDGFYDDIPARFEKLIASISAVSGS